MRSNSVVRGIMSVRAQAYDDPVEEVRSLIGEVRQKIEARNAKMDDMGQAIDDLSQRMAGMRVVGNSPIARRDLAPFAGFVRTGAPQAGMTTDSNPDGGYLVPQTVDSVIQNQLISLSPLRGYASIVTLSQGAGHYSFNVNLRGATAGWVGEKEARPETASPTLGSIKPPEGEIYANPKVSQWLLDDSAFNVETFIQENLSDEFAVTEGAAFVSGDGINKPKGYLTLTNVTTADASRAFGQLQYVGTGNGAGFASTDPGDALINMVYALKAPYRAGPGVAWMMNSTTASVVRQFKDNQHRYLWQESIQAGQPSTLLGYPVAIDENMPDLGSGALPVAFGNWKLGYRIVDRLGTRVLRDPYTNKPFVQFYTTKRVGGSVADSNAIKLLKCA